MKEKTKSITDVVKDIKTIEKKLQIECTKCDGTGSPKTKLGKPPKDGGKKNCKECLGTGFNGDKIDVIEKNITSMKKDIKRIGDNLNAYIDRQFTEIRVLPKGSDPSKQGFGGWEDYSGDFYLNSKDQKDMVIKKAKKHFHTYFEDGVYHRNKRLGLFLSSPRSGKHLIEEMKTGD